jgi:hypothetical protein
LLLSVSNNFKIYLESATPTPNNIPANVDYTMTIGALAIAITIVIAIAIVGAIIIMAARKKQ